jgi:hypothetical protein
MRLTLRTLLSYLDDTLEPAQAKVIGQKVAESEQARELTERIQQVTRRRRLTTPPTSGPGGLDPNTMAEYLDNEVSPEQAAEVEQVCLASDVHLAEVAACHQILTLVLGEPALVPPSAKQRMYGLVKGPEAIPSRKPTRSDSRVDMDLSSEIAEADETLRLGLPWLSGLGGWRNQVLLVGGGIVATGLLIVALLQLIGAPARDDGKPVINPSIAQAPAEPARDVRKVEGREEVKAPTPTAEPVKPDEKKVEVDEVPVAKAVEAIPIKVDLPVVLEVPFAKPDPRELAIGKLQGAAKKSAVLWQHDKARSDWRRVATPKGDVYTNRPLLALPAMRGNVQLASGVQLTLAGNLPELTQAPLYESRVELYPPDKLNADLLLQRGRIVLTCVGETPVYVRVRFEGARTDVPEYADISLLSSDAVLIVERFAKLSTSEPFYEDPKHPNRIGPTAYVNFAQLAGSATVKIGDVGYTLSPPPGAYLLLWNSAQGVQEVPPSPTLLEVFKDNPTMPKELEKYRTGAIKAQAELIANLEGKALDVALAETVKHNDQAARQIALRCYGAIDDLATIMERFEQDTSAAEVRGTCIDILRGWVAQRRDNAYVLLDYLKKRYNKTGVALKIVDLLHYLPKQRLEDPVTYESLIDDLNNPLLPIRELSAWHLYQVVPAGQKISYSPTAPAAAREAAQNSWFAVVPRGQLPRAPQPAAGKKM